MTFHDLVLYAFYTLIVLVAFMFGWIFFGGEYKHKRKKRTKR